MPVQKEVKSLSPEIDLDDVLLSCDVVKAWVAFAKPSVEALVKSGKLVDTSSIPDERARINSDGTLTIFVTIPNCAEFSMVVPADQWAPRSQGN